MNTGNGAGLGGPAGGRGAWPVYALLVVGGWLVISPLVLATTRVTAGLISAITGGLAVAVLASWALAARNRVPPLAIAGVFGLWLLLAPSLWEFGDGVDSDPGLVPVAPTDVTEPVRAVVTRAEWNSVLTGLVILLLAGAALLAARRQARTTASASGGPTAALVRSARSCTRSPRSRSPEGGSAHPAGAAGVTTSSGGRRPGVRSPPGSRGRRR